MGIAEYCVRTSFMFSNTVLRLKRWNSGPRYFDKQISNSNSMDVSHKILQER